MPAAALHRLRGRYLRRCPVQVDDAGIAARGRSARDEDLAHVIERMAAVVADQGVALAEALPRASSGGVEASHRLVGARVEGAAVGRHVDPRVKRQVQRPPCRARAGHRRSCAPPGTSGPPSVISISPLLQRGDARVPTAGRHALPKAPRIGVRVEDVRLDEAVELGVLVPAGEEQGPVHEVGQAAAEDVVARRHVHRRVRARGGVPHRGAGVVVDRVGLGCVVAHRVVGEHLPVLEQRDVHAHHRPVDNRAPLAHFALVVVTAAAAASASLAVAAMVRRSSRRSSAGSWATESSSSWPSNGARGAVVSKRGRGGYGRREMEAATRRRERTRRGAGPCGAGVAAPQPALHCAEEERGWRLAANERTELAHLAASLVCEELSGGRACLAAEPAGAGAPLSGPSNYLAKRP